STDLSYAQTKEIRQFKVQFTDSVLITDLHNNSLKIFDIEGKLIKEINYNVVRNDLFIEEIRYFLDCIKNKKKSFLDISVGRKSLEIGLRIKKLISNERIK
ncbi:MAG: hypothetical protein WC867_07185, partial [Candidatus Pacearchaeota archaeon]